MEDIKKFNFGFRFFGDEWERFGGYPLPAFKLPELYSLTELGLSAQMIGTMLLGAYSAAIGNSYVGVCRGRQIYPNIYALNLSESGNYKSLILEIFTKKLNELQIEMDSDTSNLHKMMAATGEKVMEHPHFGIIEIGKYPKFFISGGTIEGVLDKMMRYDRGTVIALDEAYTFFKSFGQYTKTDNSEKQYYIQLFENILPTIVTKNGKDFKNLSDVCLTILGNMTISKISKVFDLSDDDGFKERFIFAYEGERKVIDLPSGNYRIERVDLALQGIFRSRAYKKVVEIPEYCDLLIRKWAIDKMTTNIFKQDSYIQKLKKYYFKILILLKVIREEKEITEEVAEYALHLVDFYFMNYSKVFKYEEEDPIIKLTDKQRRLYEILPEKFKFNDAFSLNILKSKSSVSAFLRNKDLFVKKENFFYKTSALEQKE